MAQVSKIRDTPASVLCASYEDIQTAVVLRAGARPRAKSGKLLDKPAPRSKGRRTAGLSVCYSLSPETWSPLASQDATCRKTQVRQDTGFLFVSLTGSNNQIAT